MLRKQPKLDETESLLDQEQLLIEGYRPFIPNFPGVYDSFTPQMARENYAHFMQDMPDRLAQLRIAMNATGGADIVLDYSDASLADVGGWFTHRVALRTLTSEEKSRGLVGMPEWFIPLQSDTDLTELSYSLSVDFGIYFGECMRHAHPQLRWELLKRPKSNVDINQPVLVPFRATMHLNPIRVALVLARKAIEGISARQEIIEAKQIWDSYVIEATQ